LLFIIFFFSLLLSLSLSLFRYGLIILGNPRVLAKDSMLWWHLLMDYKNNDLLLEGPLNNLAVSPINLPRPQRRSERNRAMGGGGGGHGGDNRRDDFERSGPRYDDYANVDSRDDPRYSNRYNEQTMYEEDQGYGYAYDYVHHGDGYGDDDYDDMSYGYAAGSTAQYEETYGDGTSGDGKNASKAASQGFATQPASQSQASFTQNTEGGFSQQSNFSQDLQ